MYFKYKKLILLFTGLFVLFILVTYNISNSDTEKDTTMAKTDKPQLVPDSNGKISLTDEQWKKILTEEEYRILRQGGTERGGTGAYYHNKEKGKYLCAGCGYELFESDTKYDSGSGWPAFFKPASDSAIAEIDDSTLGMRRIEVRCSRCDGHLGHVFDDGPNPTGLRYCVNSASLQFKPAKPDSSEKK